MNELQNICSIQNKIDNLELLLFLPKNVDLSPKIQTGGSETDSDILLKQLCQAEIKNGTVLYGNDNLQVTIRNNLANKTESKNNANCNYFAKGTYTVVYIVSINNDPNEYILRVNYQRNKFDYDKYVKDAKLDIKKYLPKYLYYGELKTISKDNKKIYYTIGSKYKHVEDASFGEIHNKITFINNLIDLLTIIEDSEPKGQWIINDLKSSNIGVSDDFVPIIIDYDNSTIDTRVHTYTFALHRNQKFKGSKSMADGFVEIFIKVFFGEKLFILYLIYDKEKRQHTDNNQKIKEYFDVRMKNIKITEEIQNWCNKIINYENNIYTGLWSYYPIQFKEFKLQQKK